jgi:dipeptidyl-peptidase-4
MRTLLLTAAFLAALLSAGGLSAQGTQPVKPLDGAYLRTHAQTRGFMLGRPVKPQPTPDGSAVLFLRSEATKPKQSLYEFDVKTKETRELASAEKLLKGAEEKLSPAEKAERERMRVSTAGFASFQLSGDGQLVLLALGGRLYTLHRGTGAVTELKTGKGPLLAPKFSPDDKYVSYVRDNDVYVLDLANQKETRVTTGGTDLVPHGLAEFVAQEEMNRYTGYWWSPDSKQIAYQETDHNGVEIWYVSDPANPDQPPYPSYYPRPGKANAKVKLGVVPVGGGKTTWIDWDAKIHEYMAAVNWSKHGPLTVVVQNRLQTEMAVLAADVTTGKTTPLLAEKDAAWVNIHPDMPHWLPDGAGFLWITDRNGGNQVELHAGDGKLIRALTEPDLNVHSVVSVDAKRGLVALLAYGDDCVQLHGYRVSLTKVGNPTRFTNTMGIHTLAFSHGHEMYVDKVRPLEHMPYSAVHAQDGKRIAVLPSVADSPPFVPQVEYRRVEAAGDKRWFHAVVIRPRNFDAGKRYPVVVDVYGGPQHLNVIAMQQRWLLDQWLADQGFVVVALDGRGTPGRGREWERSVKHKFGSVPLEDQVLGVNALVAALPGLDGKRVGITGWSFGGYLSALAVLKRPDVFHAGVAGAPVTDWYDYDTHYTERYLGVPPQDKAAYAEGSVLAQAGTLKRPLLIIHGTADDNVYFRHSLRLGEALFREGREFEMLPLPSLTHMVPDPVVMERLHTRTAGFFKKHLGGPGGKI